MIYCNLKGGLGNMLFQIAACKSFALNKNTDCSFPNFITHLNFLNEEKVHNPNLNYSFEYLNFLKLNTFQPLKQVNTYKFPFEYSNYVPSENSFYIDGFFQSEKYFSINRQKIVEFLKPNETINNLLITKYNEIIDSNSVSVHVRRGDYLRFTNHHPVQKIEYYLNGLETINDYETIVVFSDDIEWCKNNLLFDKKTFFIENEKDYIELFLMTKCKSNIISNSSFSWWGAWLNQENNNKVIAPKNWFGNDLNHLKTHDIYAQNWKVI